MTLCGSSVTGLYVACYWYQFFLFGAVHFLYVRLILNSVNTFWNRLFIRFTVHAVCNLSIFPSRILVLIHCLSVTVHIFEYSINLNVSPVSIHQSCHCSAAPLTFRLRPAVPLK